MRLVITLGLLLLALYMGIRGNTRISISVNLCWFSVVLLILLAIWVGLGG